MKKKKIFLTVICTLLFSILLMSTIIFSACKANDTNNTEQTTNKQETIELTLNNYSEYFTLQEEVLTYDKNDYKSSYGFNMTKVNQTTKLSIIKLYENIKFNKVVLTVQNNTKTGSVWASGDKKGQPVYQWEGNGGDLKLSFDGSGFLTLIATYDHSLDDLSRYPMKYTVSKIKGSITIEN